MSTGTIVRDIAVTTAAGYVASKAMTPVTTKIMEQETEEAKRREQEVQPEPSYQVAARKGAEAAGAELGDQQAKKAGTLLHYALGMSWGPLYALLRRTTGLTPWGAGLAAGTSLYLIVDEGLNPLLGLTPPPRAFPAVTHLRGLAGHLVYGLAVAGVTELAWRIFGGGPKRR